MAWIKILHIKTSRRLLSYHISIRAVNESTLRCLERLDELELPYVLLDWQSATDGRPNISFDCEQSMFKATIYLIQKGHKKK